MSLADDIFRRFAEFEELKRQQQYNSGHRSGKSTLNRQMANTLLDAGRRVRLIRNNIDVTIERVEGVDFIINRDGSRCIDGSDLINNG